MTAKEKKCMAEGRPMQLGKRANEGLGHKRKAALVSRLEILGSELWMRREEGGNQTAHPEPYVQISQLIRM